MLLGSIGFPLAVHYLLKQDVTFWVFPGSRLFLIMTKSYCPLHLLFNYFKLMHHFNFFCAYSLALRREVNLLLLLFLFLFHEVQNTKFTELEIIIGNKVCSQIFFLESQENLKFSLTKHFPFNN